MNTINVYLSLYYSRFSKPHQSRFTNLFTEIKNRENFIWENANILGKNLYRKNTPAEEKAFNLFNVNNSIPRTALMIKNLPKYADINLIKYLLLSICKINYIYIPQNEKSNKILGFAFVNIVDQNDISILIERLDLFFRKLLPNEHNKKVEVCYAKMYNLMSLIDAFGSKYIVD